VPIFRDVQEKVVIFPDLAQHDTEVLRFRQEITKPLFPGQFFWVLNFPRTVAWEDVEFRIRVPQGMTLHSEVVGMAEEVSPVEGGTLHVWRYRRTDVVAEDLAALSSWERLPRLMISTLPDYAALAEAYARGAAGTAEVTPDIQAKADEITAGITDRRAQARAIYEWVSAHVRYVALYLGVGGVVPHTAGEVLANGYGDCKDHTALFEALLKAKGIVAQTVLINIDNAYRLSAAPTLAQLNHVITYLPEFDLYADTTTAMAPFGVLPFQEYGKPAVVVGAGAAALRRIPLLTPGLAGVTALTDARMQLDGAILGTTHIEATGPAAIALRLAARWVQTAGHEGAARRQLGNLGEQGSGVFAFASPDGFEPSYVVNGRFQLDPMPELLEGDSFAPPLGLLLLIRPGDFFLGPLHRPALPVDEDTPCFSGRQVEELRLELPEGRVPVRLPKDTDIRNPQFTYTSRWKLAGQVVSVRRELVAAFDAPLCSGALRREAAAAMVRIRRDQRANLVLNEP
jgi:transglutaminase-like putative cysteine protease